MKNIKTVTDLKTAIQELKYKQDGEWPLLKEQFLKTYESLKPLNVIKNTFKEFISAPDFKDNIVGATAGLTAGYLSKVLVVGVSHNPIKKLLGTFLQLGVSSVVSKNPETIKSLVSNIMDLFNKNKKVRVEV